MYFFITKSTETTCTMLYAIYPKENILIPPSLGKTLSLKGYFQYSYKFTFKKTR